MRLISNHDSGGSELKLTQTEAYLVNCFRQLQDDAQELLAETVAVMAADPDSRRHTGPTLSIIQGGAE